MKTKQLYDTSVFSFNKTLMSAIKEKLLYLESFIGPLKSYYDYILIDVPTTKPVIIDSEVLSSDYVLLVLQTQQLSLDGTEMYIENLKDLYELYNKSFDICGALPVLLDNPFKITNNKFYYQIIESL